MTTFPTHNFQQIISMHLGLKKPQICIRNKNFFHLNLIILEKFGSMGECQHVTYHYIKTVGFGIQQGMERRITQLLKSKHIDSPASQCTPSQPGKHRQWYPSIWFKQIPSFKHGFEVHWSSSVHMCSKGSVYAACSTKTIQGVSWKKVAEISVSHFTQKS